MTDAEQCRKELQDFLDKWQVSIGSEPDYYGDHVMLYLYRMGRTDREEIDMDLGIEVEPNYK